MILEVEEFLIKKEKKSIFKLTKIWVYIVIFSISTYFLFFIIVHNNINYDFIKSDFNFLKIINIYILLLGLFMTILNLFKGVMLNKEYKNLLYSLNEINLWSTILIPLYFLSIVLKSNKFIYFTLFFLILICFYFLIAIILLLYFSFKKEMEK